MNKKTVFVFSSPSNHNSRQELEKYTTKLPDFKAFDILYLSSQLNKVKVLKKDLELDFTVLDNYDIICPVGSEVLKHLCKLTSITKYNGMQVEGKYFPIYGLGYLVSKPQATDDLMRALKLINKAQTDSIIISKNNKDHRYIGTAKDFLPILEKIKNATTIGVDIETTGFKFLKHSIIGINFSTQIHEGYFVSIDVIRIFKDELGRILRKKKCLFHNGKFDQQFLRYELGWVFDDYEDTMLLHYCLEEAVGTHGLKDLAIKFTDLGDYDRELGEFKKEYCRKHKILQGDFNFGLIPIEILSKYGAADGDATQQIFHKFKPLVENNSKFKFIYDNLLIPGSKALLEVELNGGPINLEYLKKLSQYYLQEIEIAKINLKTHPDIKKFEEIHEKNFNPNSPAQLSKLFFEVIGLAPLKLTATGNYSTDVEVLNGLNHPLAKDLLALRKLSKLHSTYVSAILEEIDPDGRLRSSFNLHGTTSGRLSSSGSLNYQNIPRKTKDGKEATIKIAFSARPGYAIVQGDLKTAEVYVGAVLSNDKFLQKAFVDKLDFHSYIAKQAFNLNCPVEEVGEKYPYLRQVAKSITFGIMYQAGPRKIAEQANAEIKDPAEHITYEQSKEFIAKYFSEAKNLKKFIKSCNDEIEVNKFIYNAMGRKRRLREVDSPNKAIAGHALRSGVNFLVQSVASDINILALIDSVQWILDNNHQNTIIPFTIVHDSIVAEVKIELIPLWIKTLKSFVQKDRGISIPTCPIEMDFEIGVNWGMLEKVPTNINAEMIQESLLRTQAKYDKYLIGLDEDIEANRFILENMHKLPHAQQV